MAAPLTPRVDALEAKVDALVTSVDALVALVRDNVAPAGAPAKGKAKSDADPFPVALAKARTRKCVNAKHYDAHGVHRGKRADGMFTPNGAEFHAEHSGGIFE